MFPEFQAISCRVVRDFYHKYTVDEHTLLTIRNLERLTTPSTPSRGAFGGLLARPRRSGAARAGAALPRRRQVARRRPRARERPHGAADVRAARAARRLARDGRVPDPDTTCRCRSSRSAATRRIRRSSGSSPDLVGIEERLKMLCLLTLADVEAVSLETLTPWREELLWRLYVDTYNHLTLGYGDERIERDQADVSELLAGRPADVVGDGDRAVPRGAAAPLPAAVRARGHLPPRPAVARHQAGPRARVARARRARRGS